MKKRKVQSILFYCDASNNKHFLLLKTNKRRGLFWQSVTGGVDEGEDYIDAAKREAHEETQLLANNIKSITKSQLRFEFHDQWNNDVVEKVFFIECFQKWDVLIDTSEHCDFVWCKDNDINNESVKYESNLLALKEAMKLNV